MESMSCAQMNDTYSLVVKSDIFNQSNVQWNMPRLVICKAVCKRSFSNVLELVVRCEMDERTACSGSSRSHWT